MFTVLVAPDGVLEDIVTVALLTSVSVRESAAANVMATELLNARLLNVIVSVVPPIVLVDEVCVVPLNVSAHVPVVEGAPPFQLPAVLQSPLPAPPFQVVVDCAWAVPQTTAATATASHDNEPLRMTCRM